MEDPHRKGWWLGSLRAREGHPEVEGVPVPSVLDSGADAGPGIGWSSGNEMQQVCGMSTASAHCHGTTPSCT